MVGSVLNRLTTSVVTPNRSGLLQLRIPGRLDPERVAIFTEVTPLHLRTL